jgi:hypothetical protein
MKLVLTLLGIVLLIVSVIYFVLPADQLPSFLPGYETGVARAHTKHGALSGLAGIALLAAGWFVGKKS